MREDLPTGEVTLLLTDIEGSTRLLHKLGSEDYAEALAVHRRLLREAFQRHGGVEVDTQGDAFFIAFPNPVGAVEGAVAAQRALARHDWTSGGEVRVRMGLHVGRPQRTDEGYVGMEVHAAARIASLAHGGQVLISQALAETVKEPLAGGPITLRDLGRHTLKDVESQQLFQLVPEGLAADFPPLRSMESRPNNLPVPLTPFIGRGKLVADVRDLILRTDVRAVTLLGPGGTGKTRMSIRVATELLYRFEDGVFFVPLAPVTDPDLVVGSIASVLEVREEAGTSLIDTLAAYLADKELLLVLDNFEQVQDAARDIAALLSRCVGVKFLTTSRQPLRISGERGVPVPPLALPDPDARFSLEEARQFEAISLFADRAQAARWDFELTDRNMQTVAEICRKVDALPLAIELAAGRLYAMNTEELLAALEHRLNVLTEGAVDLLDHQRTLRDLVAWSYELLDEDERILWRRLAVFNGGWNLEAARDVCDVNAQFDIEAEMENLAGKSLLTLEGDGEARATKVVQPAPDRDVRVSMLETLREYAAEQLSESGERPELVRRHGRWFLDLAENAQPHLRSTASSRWQQRLGFEMANFRAAMDRALEDETKDPALAIRLATALHFFWYRRGLMTEARERLQQALDSDPAPSELRTHALMAAASLARYQNQPEVAEPMVQEALQISTELDDQSGIANSLRELGALAERDRDYDRAREFFEKAIALYRNLSEPERLAWTYNNLGIVAQLTGSLDEAAGHYEASLGVGREIDDPMTVATAFINLGEIAQLQGRLDQAKDYFRDSLGVWQSIGHRLPMAHCLEILASIDLEQGRPGEAAELLGAADAVREEISVPVEPFNKERYDRDLEGARTALGEGLFEEAWQRGRALTIDEAVAAARVDLEGG